MTLNLADESLISSRSTRAQNDRLVEENEYLSSQVTKMKEQLKELREEVNECYQSERVTKRDLTEKLNELDN